MWFAASLGALCLTVSRSHAAVNGEVKDGVEVDGVPLSNFAQDETNQYSAENFISNRYAYSDAMF